MSPIFKSGAFIQQCFAVHPLCLTIKKLAPPVHLLLSCTSCQLTHRISFGTVCSSLPGQNEPSKDPHDVAQDRLSTCVETHRTELGVSGMDVVKDRVELRCGECRRRFLLERATFETHQR